MTKQKAVLRYTMK